MNRITTLYFRRIPSGLGFGHKIESHATCTAVRLYASGGVKSGGRGGAAATSSKKSPSLSKHSPPELKNINATLSPSSIASNSTAGKPSTMATTAAVPRESIGSKTRRGGTGSFPNFSRNLAEMCTKQDVVFYEPPPTIKKTFMLAYITAGLQMIFWGNVAQYAFTHYTDNPIFSATQPPPPPLPLPGTEGVESTDLPLAPLRKRIIISAGLVGTGFVIAFGICAVPWRYVTKLTLLRGGTQIRIETGRKFPKGYHRIYPIQDMQCRQQLLTNVGPQGTSPAKEGSSAHIMLGSKKERMSFFIDRRGWFKDPALWDKIFHKPY